MPARLALTVLGSALDLECVGPRAEEAYDALARRWSLCARAGHASGASGDPFPGHLEVALGEPVLTSSEHRVAGPDLGPLLVALTQAVTRAAIAANIGRLLMFHAGALSNQDTGSAVVLVAAGGTGKTTACRTLGPGRGYLSDETVGIGADDQIVVYPKPLSVRRPGSDTKDEVDPVAAGLAPPRTPPRVGAILVLDRDDSWSAEATVERLDPLHAITDLVTETSSLESLPRPLHRLLGVLERVDLLARVRYRESASLEPLVARLIGPPESGRVGTPDGSRP